MKRTYLSATSIYKRWYAMVQRCTNTEDPAYQNYVGRGIRVCARWLGFDNFYADVVDPPKGKSLDRIDNDKGYEMGNFRWATREVQNRNQRSNRTFTYCGFTGSAIDVIDRFWVNGLSYKLFLERLSRYGWSLQQALTTPSRRKV